MSTLSSRSPSPVVMVSSTFTRPEGSKKTVSDSFSINTHPVTICVCQPSECVCATCKRCCPGNFPSSVTRNSELPLNHERAGSYGSISPPPEDAKHCHCHEVEPKSAASKTARNKLIAACLIALLFMTGEAVGMCSLTSCIVQS